MESEASLPRIKLPPVKMMPITDVRPYHRNPRRNEKAIPAVKESIRRYGMNQPIVVDKKGVIVVGHTRFQALVELGAKEVPTVCPDLTPQQVREYRIADNKTGEIADWDRDPLMAELRAINGAEQVMAPFFPRERELTSLLRESTGASQRPVDQEQIDKVLANQPEVSDYVRATTSAMIRIECPHCGEGFMLARDTIASHPGERE